MIRTLFWDTPNNFGLLAAHLMLQPVEKTSP
jgi:hypothetical protein